MKHQIAKRRDGVMDYFTPQLVVKFNSDNPVDADEAEHAWEKALGDYQKYLKSIEDEMPSDVKAVAACSFHDAEILGLQEHATGGAASSLATLSISQRKELITLVYVLWEPIREHESLENWPFSKTRRHWLYDEIHLLDKSPSGSGHRLMHRILLSDGMVWEIPFASVAINRVTQDEMKAAGLLRSA